MRYRKTEMARAVDLRQRRRALGISAEKLADMLGCADSKHVSAIETGRCAITITKAARAAYHLGAVTVDVEDVGPVVVMPAARMMHLPVTPELRPGEAAWIAMEEQQEAIASIHELQRAVLQRDRETLVRVYEQVVCDPMHAVSLVAASIDAIDPSIGVEARERHVRKLAAWGLAPADAWEGRAA